MKRKKSRSRPWKEKYCQKSKTTKERKKERGNLLQKERVKISRICRSQITNLIYKRNSSRWLRILGPKMKETLCLTMKKDSKCPKAESLMILERKKPWNL